MNTADSGNIRHTVSDLYDRCVQRYGPHVALSSGDRSVTYAELGDQAHRLRAALSGLGIGAGDTVAFLMANCPEYVFCEYAVAKTGAVRVPLAVLLAPDDHVFMMNFAECKTLIYHAKFAERVAGMLPGLTSVERLICVADDAAAVPDGHLHLQALIAGHEPDCSAPVSIDPEDLCGIYFTGGTTGKPKGVMLSHRAWIQTYLIEMLDFGMAWDEVFAFPTPLTHAGGCLILPVLLRRGRGVILDGFDPEEFLRTIEREGITSTFLVPTMIYMLLDHPHLTAVRLDSLRNVIYGAAAIAPERLKQALDVFGPVFTQLYGQTEAPMAISALSREEHVVKDPVREKLVHASAGRPTYHAEVRLLDDEGREVPRGESGEIVVRCSNMMSGYLKSPEATREAIRDGWLHTGDMGRFDDEGFLYIVDRKKDMIVSGGFNVYPREIEDVLHDHPAVGNVAVVGIPHPKWGEEVRAVVMLRDGQTADPEELIAFVKARKGSVMAPKAIEFWDEIPLTNLGKLDKKRIRILLQEACAGDEGAR